MGKISNKKILLYTFLVKVSVILRLIFAPTIFIFPRLTAIVSLIFDWVDGELYKRAGYDHSQYGTYDKILDYYWYVWILFYILMNNVPYKLLFIGLFFYRTIGQILFFFTKKEIFLLIFCNVYEIFFFYYLLVTVQRSYTYLLQPPFVWIALAVISVLVLIREYLLHRRNINLSGLFSGKTTYWPTRTFNPYKVFTFFAFLLTIIASIFLMSQAYKKNIYKNQAREASGEGEVIYYSSEGYLTGWIKAESNLILDIHLFDNQNYLKPKCISQVKTTSNNQEEDQNLFFYQNTCLKSLPNSRYYLLLVSKKEKKKSYLLNFVITNGRIED